MASVQPTVNGIGDVEAPRIGTATGSNASERYEFLNILGKGSSAKVWKAFDRQEKREVAIKEFESWEGSGSQYNREVITLKALNASDKQGHYVLRIFDTCVRADSGKSCIVMEYVPGRTLGQVISEGAKSKNSTRVGLSMATIETVATDLLRTLKFLAINEMSMLHGDLKPDNIILEFDDAGQVLRARLIDFGLAFKSRGPLKRNMYIQSRWYRAPEVLLGIPATPQIDVWSLGCVFVEMFAGVCPFRGTDSYDQMLLIMDALGLPSDRLRKSCEDSTLSKVDEMVAIVQHRWQQHLDVPAGMVRTSHDIEKRLKRKLLTHRAKREDETEQHRVHLVDLISKLLRIDPYERLSAADCLNHPFVTGSAAMSLSEQSQAIPPKFTASEIRKRQTYITKSRFPVSSPSPAKDSEPQKEQHLRRIDTALYSWATTAKKELSTIQSAFLGGGVASRDATKGSSLPPVDSPSAKCQLRRHQSTSGKNVLLHALRPPRRTI